MAHTHADIPGDTIPKSRPNADPGNIKLTREDRQVLARIDGRQTIADIIKKTGLGSAKVQGILRFLAERRMVELPGAEVTGPRPAMSDQSGPRPAAADRSGPRPAAGATPPPRPAVGTLGERLMQTLPRGEEIMSLIEEIFANLETISYYDLLGLTRDADPSTVKKAYLLRTKAFHPDRFYRRANHDFKNKLQEIFKQVNKGYRVLSDAEQRKAYDATLVAEEKTAAPSEAPVSPVTRERAVKGEAPSDRPFDRGAKAAPKKIAAEAASEAEVASAAAVAPPEKPEPAKIKLGLRPGEKPIPAYMEKMIREKAKGQQASTSQAERFFMGAMVERDRGNYAAAKINLKLAMQYAPYEAKYKAALEQMDQDEENKKAELKFKAGLEAHGEGDLQGAAIHYRQALQLGYENAKLYHKFADLLIELEGNFEKARALCLKAIEMQSGVPDFHLTLARAYKGLGQKGAAVLQLEKVVNLDPKNKLAAKELKALKRS